MASYKFKAYRPDGLLEQGAVQAVSEQDAVKLIKARGLLPFLVAKATLEPSSNIGVGIFRRRDPCTFDDYAVLARELATLLDADLTIDQALRLVQAGAGNSRLRGLAEQLLESVVAGSPLSDALMRHATGAPPYFANIVCAGEARGNVGATLQELADFLEARVDIRTKLKSALVYPLILAVAALATIAIVAVFLVPNLMSLFKDTGSEPPVILQAIETVSAFLAEYWPLVTGATCVAAIGIAALSKNRTIQLRASRLVNASPLLGLLVRDAASSLFARTLGTLTQSGVPLIAALQLVSNVMPNQLYSDAVGEATERVKEGVRLSAALERTGHFSPMAVRFVAVGEETGKLERMLLRSSAVLDKQIQRRIERGMTLLGPALTILIGLLVGGLMVSVMQALLSVNEIVLR